MAGNAVGRVGLLEYGYGPVLSQASRLLIKTQDGNPRRNPLVKIGADAAADMVRFANEFGLTAVARSRLAGGVYSQPPPNKFDGLLAGPNNKGEK